MDNIKKCVCSGHAELKRSAIVKGLLHRRNAPAPRGAAGRASGAWAALMMKFGHARLPRLGYKAAAQARSSP